MDLLAKILACFNRRFLEIFLLCPHYCKCKFFIIFQVTKEKKACLTQRLGFPDVILPGNIYLSTKYGILLRYNLKTLVNSYGIIKKQSGTIQNVKIINKRKQSASL